MDVEIENIHGPSHNHQQINGRGIGEGIILKKPGEFQCMVIFTDPPGYDARSLKGHMHETVYIQLFSHHNSHF